MKSRTILTKTLALLCLLIGSQFSAPKQIKYRTGDLIFFNNANNPDKLLQELSKSKFSHLGFVSNEKGKLSVYYAGAKVKKTTLPEFLALSQTGKYEVLRFKDTLMLSNGAERMIVEANRLVGNLYDKKYSWLDMEIYSTELIWKIYKRGLNIELCPIKPLSKIELSDTLLRKKIKLVFGDTIPEFTKIVSATDIYNSEFLIKIK